MAQDAAIVTTWKSPATGREKEALDCFMDWLTLMGKKAAEGDISQPEPYLKYDGSGGFGVVRGKSDKLLELWESDDFRSMLAKVQLSVNDVRTEIYAAGDSVNDTMQRYAQVASELGYL